MNKTFYLLNILTEFMNFSVGLHVEPKRDLKSHVFIRLGIKSWVDDQAVYENPQMILYLLGLDIYAALVFLKKF